MSKTQIQALCKQKGVKQIDLARLLGMREDSLSIALKKDTLSIGKLDKIADYLGVGIAELFDTSKASITCPHCGKPLNINITIE